jgi:CDP-glucose 4,6-dehydratase
VRGDVTDQQLLERALGEYEIDSVIHLAAQTTVGTAGRNPIATFETNIMGTWSLLDACKRSPTVKQVVVASSDKAYGASEVLPYSEDTPLRPLFPYDVSKAAADMIAQCYAAMYELPVVITRCGNFFGGGDLNWNRIVPGTIRSLMRGSQPIIRSDGTYMRDYFYSEDGAATYMMLCEKLSQDSSLAGQAFNFSTEIPLSVIEMVTKITQAVGSDLEPIIERTARGEIVKQALSAEKARTQLDWSPQFSIEEVLRRTVDWYKAYFQEETWSDPLQIGRFDEPWPGR